MSVRDDFLAGRPMAQPVIDIHTHLPPRELFYRASGESRWRIPSIGGWQQHETCSLAGIVRHMDRLGIGKAFAFVNGFERLEEGFECVRRCPGRLLPTISFWPGMGKEDEGETTSPGGRRVPDSPRELRDALELVHKKGWRGIKLWDPQSPQPLTWLYEGVLGFAHENRLIIVHHSWGPASTLDRLAAAYPNVTFIMGHVLGSRQSIESFATVLRRSNVFASTTNSRHPGTIEAMVEVFGAEKVVMGTDSILHTMEFSIGNIAYARIPDEARRRILGVNMKDVLTGLGYWDTWGYDATGGG